MSVTTAVYHWNVKMKKQCIYVYVGVNGQVSSAAVDVDRYGHRHFFYQRNLIDRYRKTPYWRGGDGRMSAVPFKGRGTALAVEGCYQPNRRGEHLLVSSHVSAWLLTTGYWLLKKAYTAPNNPCIYKNRCIMNNSQRFLTKLLKSLLVKLKTLHFFTRKLCANVENRRFLTFLTAFST